MRVQMRQSLRVGAEVFGFPNSPEFEVTAAAPLAPRQIP
jgi:hypothetical protein